jgi:hypothetical protein
MIRAVPLGEIALQLGFSTRTARRWRWRWDLPPARARSQGQPMWDWPEVDAGAVQGPRRAGRRVVFGQLLDLAGCSLQFGHDRSFCCPQKSEPSWAPGNGKTSAKIEYEVRAEAPGLISRR